VLVINTSQPYSQQMADGDKREDFNEIDERLKGTVFRILFEYLKRIGFLWLDIFTADALKKISRLSSQCQLNCDLSSGTTEIF
jgi:hypothetical protein